MECAFVFVSLLLFVGMIPTVVVIMDLRRQVRELLAEHATLTQRLDWVSRQLFARNQEAARNENVSSQPSSHASVIPPPVAEAPIPPVSVASSTPSPEIQPTVSESAISEEPVPAAPESRTVEKTAEYATSEETVPVIEPADVHPAAETAAPADVASESVNENAAAEEPVAEAKVSPAEVPPTREPEYQQAPVREAPPRKVEKPFSFEQLLSMKLIVWLAAISVAIAGGLFVKYSAEHGLLTPPIRICMASLFGIGLIIVAHLRLKQNNYIAQGLSAAGVVTLFAAVYAATGLYHLVNPTVGFGLMVAVTALAITLSLLHGQLVAGIGLIGGFLTPALIRTGSNDPLALYTYLILLQIAMMAVTRIRGWSILALLTSMLSLLWVVVWIFFVDPHSHDHFVLSCFVIASLATTMSSILRARDEVAWLGGKVFTTAIAFVTFIPGFLILMVLTAQTDFPLTQWFFLGLMSAAALVLARMQVRYEPMAYLSAILMLAMISGYALSGARTIDVESTGKTLNHVLALFGSFGGLFILGGYACMWHAKGLRACALRWGIFVAVAAILYTAVGWGVSVPDPLHSPLWAGIAAGVAAVMALLSLPIFKLRASSDIADTLLELLLSAAAILLMIPCATLNLDALRPTCFGILALALAAGCRYLRLPRLRFTMFVMVVPQIILLTACSHWYGGDFGKIIGAYLPPLALAVAIVWMLDAAYALEAQVVEALAALMAMFLTYMLVMQIFNITHPDSFSWYARTGGYLSPQMALAYVLLLMGAKLKRRVLDTIGRTVLLIGMPAGLLLSLGSFANSDSFGTIIAMFFPIFVLGVAAIWHLDQLSREQAQFLEVVAIGFGSFFVHLLTYHLFNTALKLSISDGIRLGGYLTAQLIYAYALMLVGMKWNRRASGGIGKVVLYVGLPLALLMAFGSYIDGSKPGTIASVFLPCMVLAAACVWHLDQKSPQIARILEVVAILFAMLFVQLLVVQIFRWMKPVQFSHFCVHGAYVLAQLALAYGLLKLALRLGRSTMRTIADAVLTIGLPVIIAMAALAENPYFTGEAVGDLKIVNQLLFVLGVPIPLGLWLVLDLRNVLKPTVRMCIKICVILLAFLLITAEIRHAFHVPVLTSSVAMASTELYTYSVAWLILGGALLTLGIVTRGLVARWASLAVILLTVAKVFLVDAAHLTGLLQIASFLGLGMSLFVVAFVYQKFVFGGKKIAAAV